MELRHLTPDARRTPHRVSPGEWVTLDIGSWPAEPEQSVWVTYRAAGGAETRVEAAWRYNEGENSYWRADIGPFTTDTVVRSRVSGGPAPWAGSWARRTTTRFSPGRSTQLMRRSASDSTAAARAEKRPAGIAARTSGWFESSSPPR